MDQVPTEMRVFLLFWPEGCWNAHLELPMRHHASVKGTVHEAEVTRMDRQMETEKHSFYSKPLECWSPGAHHQVSQ